MKYLGQTFSYLKKNFWLPVAVMSVPAIVACFLSTPFWEVSFVSAFDYKPYVSVSRTFRIIFGDSWQYLWPVIVISVFQIIGAALIMSAVDRHFRTGKLSLRDPVRLVNYSIFPMFVGIMVMNAVSVVLRFVLFGFVTFTQWLFGVIGLPSGAALAAISVIALALFVVHLLIITPMLFWSQIMVVYGYRFRDAAAQSYKLISGKGCFKGLVAPMLLCAGIQLLVGFLDMHAAVGYVFNFLLFLFTNVYITVYATLTFYNLSGLDRRDVKPHEMPLPQIAKQKPTEQKRAVAAEEPKEVEKQTKDTASSAKPTKPAAQKQSKSEKPVAERKKTVDKSASAKPVKSAKTEKTEKSAKPKKVEPEKTKKHDVKPVQPDEGGEEGANDVV
ncbi:MAG: hypothetical protein NC184_05890 [Roseburia sp.]|nr:hypothetical protein [Roseburia sp.]